MNSYFGTAEFLEVFQKFDHTIFPLQIFFYFLAAAIIVLCFTRIKHSSKIINGIIGFFWLWVGIVYHLLFFNQIDTFSNFFGFTFGIEGFLFWHYGLGDSKLSYKARFTIRNVVGLFFIIYSLIIYPLLNIKFENIYPKLPKPGLPCTITLVTFGVLLLTKDRPPILVLVIPFLWSVIGFILALRFDIWQDYALLLFALITAIAVWFQNDTHHSHIKNLPELID